MASVTFTKKKNNNNNNHTGLYSVRWVALESGQHGKRELGVKSLRAEHRKTYLFLGSSTQNPEQEKTEQDNMNGGEKINTGENKKITESEGGEKKMEEIESDF